MNVLTMRRAVNSWYFLSSRYAYEPVTIRRQFSTEFRDVDDLIEANAMILLPETGISWCRKKSSLERGVPLVDNCPSMIRQNLPSFQNSERALLWRCYRLVAPDMARFPRILQLSKSERKKERKQTPIESVLCAHVALMPSIWIVFQGIRWPLRTRKLHFFPFAPNRISFHLPPLLMNDRFGGAIYTEPSCQISIYDTLPGGTQKNCVPS